MNQPPPPMTTSSILGNPPVSLMYNIQMQVGSSLLGTAPQIPSANTFTPGRVVPSSSVVNNPQPPPPPPPGGPPLLGNQPSILGNPPVHFLMPQNMGPVPNRPQNPGGFTGHQFESSIPPPVPLGPGMAGPGGFNQPGTPLSQQYPPNPHQIITSRDQFGPGGDQFASSLIPGPAGMLTVSQENPGAFNVVSYPLGKVETAPVSSAWPQFGNTGTYAT